MPRLKHMHTRIYSLQNFYDKLDTNYMQIVGAVKHGVRTDFAKLCTLQFARCPFRHRVANLFIRLV